MSLARGSGDLLLRGVKSRARAGLDRLPGKEKLFKLLRGWPLPRALTRRLPVEGAFRVLLEGGGGFEIVGHGLPAENELFWEGLSRHEERESLRLWLRLCRRAAVIVDVGAHVGLYSLAAAAANPDATVIGFEPNEAAFEVFRENCSRNVSGVRPVRAALGDRDGVADFFFDEDSGTASLGRPEGRERTRVSIRTLKAYFEGEGLRGPDLVKIDVETFEPAVVAGMGDLLATSRPAMIVEVLHDDVGRELERLCPRDYEFFHIDERRGLSPRKRVVRVSHESRNWLVCAGATARALEAT